MKRASLTLVVSVAALLAMSAVGQAEGVLYGVSDWGLYSIDTSSAALTYIGPMNIASGLAPNPIDGVLYVTAGGSPSGLGILDPATAAGTFAGSFGVPGMSGLAYDMNHGYVYASQTYQGGRNSLYRFDLATNTVTEVGLFPPTFAGYNLSITGLAFDPISDTLYGTTPNGRVYTIDVNTAATITYIGSFGSFVAGLAYAPDTGLLYATTTYPNDLGNVELVAMDPATGDVTVIGETNRIDDGTNVTIFGLAYMSDAVITVDIDIKPDEWLNVIELDEDDLEVAVLMTAEFDATTVDITDLSTVKFGDLYLPTRVSPEEFELDDVDDDGDLDLVFEFEIEDTGALVAASTEAELTAFTMDGTAIRGTDLVVMEDEGDDDYEGDDKDKGKDKDKDKDKNKDDDD